jgi:hypothetical protein
MKFRIVIAIFVAFSTLQISCGSVGPIVTMTGETATVRLHDGTEESVELLAVEDSSIICLLPQGTAATGPRRVVEIPGGSISRVEVSGFRNDKWWVGVVVFEVLPAVGLTVAAGAANADAGATFAVSMIPAMLTTILYAASGVPTPTFEDPLSAEKLGELRKYARFAGRLTSSQKDQLLHMQERVAQ